MGHYYDCLVCGEENGPGGCKCSRDKKKDEDLVKKWKEIAKGTTVGHKRILKIRKRKYQRIRINIKSSFYSPTLNNIGFHLESWN